MIPKTEKQRKRQANFTPENGKKKINQTKQSTRSSLKNCYKTSIWRANDHNLYKKAFIYK